MDRIEAKQLLTMASAIDNRVVSDLAVAAWADALADIPLEAAREALRKHRRTSTEYLQPAHIAALADAAPSVPLPPRSAEGMCRIHDGYPAGRDGRCDQCARHPEDLRPGAPAPTMVSFDTAALTVGRIA